MDRYAGLYAERQASINHLIKNDETGAIGYEAGTTVVTYNTGEFVDRFKTWMSPQLGVGIFDDGSDFSRRQAVVTGDSFGRGVGAETLDRNWVETAERMTDRLDLMNISFVGSGVTGYIENYRNLAKHIPHDVVILSFDTDSDFSDSAYSTNRLQLFQSTDSLRRRGIALNYDQGCQEMIESGYRSWFLMLSSEILRRRYEWANIRLRNFFPPCPSSAMQPADIRADQQKAEQEGARFETESIKNSPYLTPELKTYLLSGDLKNQAHEATIQDYRIRIHPYHRDHSIADLLISAISRQINDFSAELTDDGKCLIIVLHPTKNDVYSDSPDDKLGQNVTARDARYPAEKLKASLSHAIGLIDPLNELRAASEHSDNLYYKVDQHYTPAGYEIVGRYVGAWLQSNAFSQVCDR